MSQLRLLLIHREELQQSWAGVPLLKRRAPSERPDTQDTQDTHTPMSINELSTSGNVIFFNPEILVRLGFPCDIKGPHPFVILDQVLHLGMTHCLVVPLTTKGSRRSAVHVPPEYLIGTASFRGRPNFIYSRWYAHWYPAWALQEACSPAPETRHNGNCLSLEGVCFVLDHVAIPALRDLPA